MRYTSIAIWFFVLAIIFAGCSEKESDTSLVQLVQIDLSEAREAKLSEFFESINYTLLDYSDEKPIVNAYKVVVTDGEYFVESRVTAEVFVFDKSGQLKNIIGQFGDGPGEIRLIDGLFVYGDTIRIDSEYANKYVLFTKDGEFIQEGKLSYQAPAIYEKDFGLYYFQHGQGLEQWTYIRQDKNETGGPQTPVTGYLPVRDGFEKFLAFSGYDGFLKDPQNGEFFYNEPNDYSVQNFDSDGYLKSTIRFDFGTYNWPLEKRLELAGKGRERNDYLKENMVVSGIYDFYPFQSFYFISTGTYNHTYWVFMDKNFESMDIIKVWENDLDGMKLRKLTWTKSADELIYQLDSRTFFNDYVAAFNGKSVAIKSGNVHEFFEKNKAKLQEEKMVLVSYKLK